MQEPRIDLNDINEAFTVLVMYLVMLTEKKDLGQTQQEVDNFFYKHFQDQSLAEVTNDALNRLMVLKQETIFTTPLSNN
jgi:hypothetical protein